MVGNDELLTVRQVAEICGVAPKTVRRWIKDGQLPATRAHERADLRIARHEVEQRFNLSAEPDIAQRTVFVEQ